MKRFLIISILVLIALFLLLARFAPRAAQARREEPQCKHENSECEINNAKKTCCEGLVCVKFNEQSGNRKCVKVTPTPTDIPEPSITPEPTPEVTPTPIPTVTPIPEKPYEHPCIGCSGPPVAPSCADLSTILLPANLHVLRAGNSATLKWWPTQGTQVNVFYKEVGQNNWTHGVGDLPNNGQFTVSALNPKLGYTFGLVQKTGCGGGQLVTAVVVDGPQPVMFTFSYWEWTK